ncbi:MAG TPA: ABC transporter permease subunit [Armatimonadota bacterium]|jgi:Cu-processing system permease protein|nr:ABC transporter permease subunit [Armatimonadota bacterium]HOM81703.1 ABC transporter permease subunit [Armatimonadota bacterium]HOQ30638.1 ABC transporter permease subunit [Armatimonadota bacterium]HPO71700.1 ABC transporter permease subunit [Armatimonadota bacterium]HPT99885.1 ABC transporter permease subunit [Armatimonadota bacterium]
MRISALAITTFREEVRRKVFLFLLLFAGVMIATSWIFSFFTGSEELKVVKDMGLTSITLAGVAIAMVMGIRMLPGEMDKRTIYTILCKPVTRSEYLIGKFLGGALTLAANTVIMGLVFLVVVFIKSKQLDQAMDFRLTYQIVLAYLQFCVLLALTLMLSTFVTPVMNGSISLFVLIVGNLSDTIVDIINMSKSAVVEIGLRILYYLVPNWQHFSVQDTLVRGEEAVPLLYVLKIALYGILYTAILMVIATQAFRNREV